jgi:error-prone DNA polymerase
MDRRLLDLAWTEEIYLSVNVRSHPVVPFRKDLRKAGFITSKTLKWKQNGERVKVAGRLVLVHTPPTRSGARVMFITIEDECGLIDLVLFSLKQKLYAKKISSNLVSLFTGRVRKLGMSDVSVIIDLVNNMDEFYLSRPGPG